MINISRKQEKFIILAVGFGVILNPLNTTMITVALPAIQKDFQLTATDISWLIASYFIISAIFTPMIGKLGDLYGRKRLSSLGYPLSLYRPFWRLIPPIYFGS